MTANPFLSPSELPYRLPDFAAIREEHFLPAFEQGVAEHLAEVDAIVANPEPATFDNTIAALERSGATLKRVETVLHTLAGSDATEGIREIEREIAPRASQHADAVSLNRDLWARIQQVTTDDPQEAWLLERYRLDFVKAGAGLGDREQERLRELNTRLAELGTEFSANVVRATGEASLVTTDAADLDGLDEAQLSAIEKDGEYVLPLLNTTVQPALAQLTDRATRERLYTLSVGRAPENLEIAARTAELRAERARLLGYPDHAAYKVADQTAGTVEAVEERLGQLVGPARRNVEKEARVLAEYAGHDIEPWDWPYYTEQVRKARYDFDESVLRPYFELGRVIEDGVFHAATLLYGVTFTERPDLAGYHPDMRTWEVLDGDGSALGLFLLDPYARPTKRGGAWMHNLVDQSLLLDERPVVVNNLNITKPVSGPALLTFDEVETAFHEFGHALHGLLSAVRFPRVEGTSVPRDFVEFPSQVNEMWALWPEVLSHYARHHETGEPVPDELVRRLTAASRFNQGFATFEYLAAALLDWAWHRLAPGETVEDPASFEARALEAAGALHPLVRPRYRSTYFQHIFSDDGYSAGYYSYVWSEVLDAESVEWFKENGGLTRAGGDRFRERVLSLGGSVDPMGAVTDFLGREPGMEPLLARKGLN
ncbi:peptidyl-dipeptidase Dcp [Nocardiopsis terrae]|uniref:Peptidyl-dipeptidase Dcp n=1 Tax=Nocardiopsis terrae TaxID=372655 RepID=A0ABR9HNY3_9ACTN|nr:M3 family metallopeptidase [Nocardiopsis terrae]MBE1460696.1 peptidyl-dipeptidase Dcp [Nocardiopsis terrae]GHC72954.1 peptidyl-dipeptidase Dcp [Nocardiopsis terrae]